MKSKPGRQPLVAVIMGSDSDWPALEPCIQTLRGLGIACEARVLSAHRSPRAAARYAAGAARRGLRVLIAGAGGAAHLAGVLAAHTTLPVIGVPMKSGALDGMDALLATLQMPAGVPVATVTLGTAGPINAAVLAAQILALSQPLLAARLRRRKTALKHRVNQGNRKIQTHLEKNHDV